MEDEKVTEEKSGEARTAGQPPTAEMPPVPPSPAATPPAPPVTVQRHYNWTLIALIVVSVIAVLLLASTIAMAVAGGYGRCGRGCGYERGFKMQNEGPGMMNPQMRRYRQQLPNQLNPDQQQQNQNQLQQPNQQQPNQQQQQSQPQAAPAPTQ